MPDITMCRGTSCPFKESCYRYTAKPNEFRQSWFVEVPYVKLPNMEAQTLEHTCEYYWNVKERK